MKIYKIKFTDGVSYSGRSATDLVDRMRTANPFTSNQTRWQYMLGYASRHFKLTNRRMRPFYSVCSFLLSLAETDEVQSFNVREKETTSDR